MSGAAIGAAATTNLVKMNPSFAHNAHIVFGGVLSGFVLFQPILGEIHHWIYETRKTALRKLVEGEQREGISLPIAGDEELGSGQVPVKAPGRTWIGLLHTWTGRLIIIGGIICGGLGE